MKTKKKTCETCSYFIIEEDINNLDAQHQIEFENFNTSTLDDISIEDINKLAFLLQNIRRQTCIGGLIKPNEIKVNCKYYANLPFELEKSQLLQSFIANYNKHSTKKSMFITVLLGLLTASLTLFGIFQNTKNRELKKSIIKNELDYKNLEQTSNHQIKVLNDSILKLNVKLKNQNNEQK
jgi:hypothetical protein